MNGLSQESILNLEIEREVLGSARVLGFKLAQLNGMLIFEKSDVYRVSMRVATLFSGYPKVAKP